MQPGAVRRDQRCQNNADAYTKVSASRMYLRISHVQQVPPRGAGIAVAIAIHIFVNMLNLS
jgi:hypothetical protein